MALCAVADGSGVLHVQGVDPSACPGAVLLSPTEYIDWLASLLTFGFDQTLFEKTVEWGLGFFAIGFGIGLLVSVTRKARF